MRRSLCLLIAVTLAVPASAQTAPVADRIWISPSKPTEAQGTWYPQSVKLMVGRVVALDDQQLQVLERGDDAPTRMAAYRVMWIEPGGMSARQFEALKLFADGDFAGSLRPLLDSLSDRPPVWRQQWLSMLAANAAWRSGRSEIALELVSQLDARPLAPYILAWLPVAWKNDRPKASAVLAAEKRLADPSAAVRLVAASWTISSPQRSQAIAALKQLSSDAQRPQIARLAEAVLWRTATPPQVTKHAADWLQKLDQLPLVLQTGPMIGLAEKFESAGLNHQANELKLSLELTPPIPYPDH